ncbi:MAG: hypothetical protein CL398_00205 [Acidiferrobacteraceae bacterium]|nr:hypothetical protein [Acidiferrobacteraceae bacterium]
MDKRTLTTGVVLGAVLFAIDSKTNLFSNIKSTVFGADGVTPAMAEAVQVERSGITADVVPVSQQQAFMGYRFLDLAGTNTVVNVRPFGPGVADEQFVYANPWDAGYSDAELIAAENYNAFAAEGSPAPGQIPINEDPTGNQLQASHHPVSLDPAAMRGVYYDGRMPAPLLPPEVNTDMAYAVTPFNAPFVTPPSEYIGANRFGDLTINSDSDALNGRFGQPSLEPEVDASYMATSVGSGYLNGDAAGMGTTMPLSSWRAGYQLSRISDTEVKAIPFSGGYELYLRRV